MRRAAEFGTALRDRFGVPVEGTLTAFTGGVDVELRGQLQIEGEGAVIERVAVHDAVGAPRAPAPDLAEAYRAPTEQPDD